MSFRGSVLHLLTCCWLLLIALLASCPTWQLQDKLCALLAGKLAVTGAALTGTQAPKADKQHNVTDESPSVKPQVTDIAVLPRQEAMLSCHHMFGSTL